MERVVEKEVVREVEVCLTPCMVCLTPLQVCLTPCMVCLTPNLGVANTESRPGRCLTGRDRKQELVVERVVEKEVVREVEVEKVVIKEVEVFVEVRHPEP